MKTTIVLPIPLESGEVTADFLPFIERWVSTFGFCLAGCAVDVMGVCIGRDLPESIAPLFEDTPITFITYKGTGCDAGAFQAAAAEIKTGFVIFSTSRVYFHRPGWGEALVSAREQFGPGLYGTSASREHRLHLCTRFFGMEAEDFLAATGDPITDRGQWAFGEAGGTKPNLLEWTRAAGKPAKLVAWSGVYDEPEWFSVPNRFRDGDQSDVLVWDRHTDIYRYSDPEQKEHLAKLGEEA